MESHDFLSIVEQKKDVSFLTNLPGASQRLRILNADLSDPDSFKEAIEDCIGVFHVATIIDFEEREPEEIVTKRSIDGALGILRACVAAKTIKRVVYTSSAAAVSNDGKEEQVKDESSWSDVDILRTFKSFGPYAISKTLTEKAVLEFGEQNGLDVVTVIPSLVVGPFICSRLPVSVRHCLYFIFDKKNPLGYLQINMVHVDELARAHIFLLEHPNPKGRYNCSTCLATIEEVSLKESSGMKFPYLSSKKLTDAGFELKYGLEEMFVDVIECCKEKGYLEL